MNWTVYLQESATGDMVSADLKEDIDSETLSLWESSWLPNMRILRADFRIETPEDSHWNWKLKANLWKDSLSYQAFSLYCEEELQGMMLTSNLESARLTEQFGKPIIFIDYVVTAPWNRPAIQSPPKYRGVGRVFILAAIQLSLETGYKGRIGLHSLPGAESFYQNKCGMTRLGPDSSQQNLVYYEMTETQADMFRRNQTRT